MMANFSTSGVRNNQKANAPNAIATIIAGYSLNQTLAFNQNIAQTTIGAMANLSHDTFQHIEKVTDGAYRLEIVRSDA